MLQKFLCNFLRRAAAGGCLGLALVAGGRELMSGRARSGHIFVVILNCCGWFGLWIQRSHGLAASRSSPRAGHNSILFRRLSMVLLRRRLSRWGRGANHGGATAGRRNSQFLGPTPELLVQFVVRRRRREQLFVVVVFAARRENHAVRATRPGHVADTGPGSKALGLFQIHKDPFLAFFTLYRANAIFEISLKSGP